MELIRRAFNRVRASLFLVPVAMILVAGGLAGLSLLIDARGLWGISENPLILSATVSGGRGIATTVAGATITVAAVVFSITALSTQMAATQYSPRVVGGFFEDVFQQAVIGLVVGTFTYSLVILAGLNDVLDQTEEATPTISVTLVIILGVVSAIAIVAYIDHSLRRMQIDSVVRRIADAAVRAVRHEQSERRRDAPSSSEHTGPPQGESTKVKSGKTGWIVDIDEDRLLHALPPHSTARVEVRVGEAVSEGDVIATVWADSGEPDLTDSAKRTIRRAIKANTERSVDSDPTFGIRQLADIALRALSPGVNDPTTAVDVIHHLKIPVREILASDPPLRVLEGEQGKRAFLAEVPSRSDYVHAAFSEIRLSASGQPYVLRALLEVLQDLRGDLEGESVEGRLAAVEEEWRLTVAAVKGSELPEPDTKRILRDHRLDAPEDE